eukprot:COSAG05_NODE_14287_length_401_cov_2.158940_2_plen_66_part_01
MQLVGPDPWISSLGGDRYMRAPLGAIYWQLVYCGSWCSCVRVQARRYYSTGTMRWYSTSRLASAAS